MTIKWGKQALIQLLEAITFIKENGYQKYAIELELKILSRIKSLPESPQIYHPDRFKRNNDGNFYAFEVDDYRISYRVTNKEIRIIRIRHTSRRVFKH